MNYNVNNFDSTVINEIKSEIKDLIPRLSELDKMVIFNVGTERIDFDSFGPILGSELSKKIKLPKYERLSMFLDIMGTIDDPCHGLNLWEKYEELDFKYSDSNIFILATDAAATLNENRFNNIVVSNKSIKPGSANGRRFTAIGDASVSLATILASKDSPRLTAFSRNRLPKKKIEYICNILSDIILDAVLEKMIEEF